MAKYRIVSYDSVLSDGTGYRAEEQNEYCQGWTAVLGTYADTPEEAERLLRKQIHEQELRNRPPIVIKELEL